MDVDLSDELLSLIKPELEPGERVLWAAHGRPAPVFDGGLFGVGTWFLVGSGAVFLFAIASINGSLGSKMQAMDGLFTFLVVASGLVLFVTVLGKIANGISRQTARRQTARGLYVITDRRAIIRSLQPNSRAVVVRSIRPGEVVRIHRVEFPDGTGDVKFTFANNGGYDFTVFDLIGVEHVHDVEELARRTLLDPARQRESAPA